MLVFVKNSMTWKYVFLNTDRGEIEKPGTTPNPQPDLAVARLTADLAGEQ